MTSKHRIGVAKGLFTVPDGRAPPATLNLHDPLNLQALLEIMEPLQVVGVGGKMQFLLGPNGSLGGLTPLQALEHPELRAKVMDLAHAFAES